MPKAKSLSQLSIAEIRRLYVDGEEPVSGQILARLRRDRRQGARAIGARLERRYEREKQESARLDALLNFERVLWKAGIERIAGVDEAGMGPLAGPVVAAAVVFPPGTEIAGIDDSKKLAADEREELCRSIEEHASWALGITQVAEIDRLNVYQAGLLAMRRAVVGLPERPQHLLIDAREIPDLEIPQNRFEKGDGLNFSIAAASIVAKTHRDRLMLELDRRYPEYGFARHKGYATREHQEAIREHGPSEVHRVSFQFIRELCGEFSELFYELRDTLAEAQDRTAIRSLEDRLDECRALLAEEETRKLRLMLSRRWKSL